MQWDGTVNAGFSTAPEDRLYLPLDPAPDRPTVAAQRGDSGSVLELVRRLIALRRSVPALGWHGDVEVVHPAYPLVYVRGDTHLVVVNPRREPAAAAAAGWVKARPLEVSGVRLSEVGVEACGFGYGVFAR